MSTIALPAGPRTSAPSAEVRAACSYCGVGCGITVTTAASPDGSGSFVSKVAGDRAHPANAGRLCTKGATHVELMHAPGRMASAYVRPARGEPAVPAPLDAAIAEAGARLRAIVDEHGPDAVAVYVSGQMSIEAQYLSNKLMKGYLRGLHLESNSRLCMASAGTGYKQSLGADGPPGSYEDLDRADLFFVIGSNMADCHPILFLRMADRLKQGAKLIVVDPRRTATAERADLYLPIAPGTDLALLNGLLHLLVVEGAIDREFIVAHTEGWDGMPEFLAEYSPARVAEVTGLAEADIRTAARWIAEAGEWMTLWTMGLNQSTQGTWHTNAICNLHLATGAICRPGSGPFSLTGRPNAMGGREMGYMGPGLPGQRAVFSPADRAFVEDVWGLAPGTIRDEAGTGTIDMFRSMAAGKIRAAWIICTNPVASVANRSSAIAGLEAAELVIVQDVFTETATNAYADILLPATLWVESEGVMVNSDRTMTLSQRAADAPGDAQPDWLTICRIAQAVGFDEGFAFESSGEVFEEIRRFWNPQTGWDIRGVDYDRLRRGPVQWPAPPGDAEDRHPIRYVNDGISQALHREVDGTVPRLAFATPSRRAQFFARPHLGPSELPDDDYPWILNTGRLQHQWHTMTKTGKVDKLVRLNPKPFVEVHPRDAEILGIAEGDQVEIASRRGRAVLPAVVTDRVQPGCCFAPFHWNDEHGEHLAVNAVTSDAVDAASLQPEFKFAAVALRRVGPASDEAPIREKADGMPLPGAARAVLTGAGVEATGAPALTEAEGRYLSGFLSALEVASVASGSVPVLPPAAPLREVSRAWFDGVLAGLYSRTPLGLPAAGAPALDEVTVLWGSQTGNAEEVASTCAATLTARGIPARTVSMVDMSLTDLASVRKLLVVTSTFGDGGPPDNAADLWDELSSDTVPELPGLDYAVFAIGDSSYDDFCGHGRSIDARLGALGATALLPRVDCEPDYAEPAAAWLEEVISTITAGDAASAVLTEAPAAPPMRRMFTRGNPVLAPLVTNRLLSGAGSAKEVRQFGFDLERAGVTYEAGDSLGVVCANAPAMVAEWLDVTGLSPHAVVELEGRERFLEDALAELDITRIGADLLAFVAERNPDPTLATLLRRENKGRLEQFLWSMHAVDLLRAFPVRAEAAEWMPVLKRLQPRQYSISSSPKTSPDEVQLTVSVVRFETETGLRRGGVASTYLADSAPRRPRPSTWRSRRTSGRLPQRMRR
nr:bifunctional nitrate reductase/sulfite reductase flavoprotein subunit alpha [Microbacterium flavescens]